MSPDEPPPRRSTASFAAVTFEREFAAWLASRDALYRLELSETQREIIVEHAASIAKKHGMP